MTRCWSCFAEVRQAATVGGPGRAPDEPSCAECGEPLASASAEPATFIVMAGARSTGKSIFIAVMIEQLRAYLERLGTGLEPADDRVRGHFEQRYRVPLYLRRGILDPTGTALRDDAHQREALHFVLDRKGGRHHLVIRDVAGEDLEKLGSADVVNADELRFFRNADAVFFLYDPVAVPTIRNWLRDDIPNDEVGGDPLPVLGRTIGLMEGGRDPKLAVVMAKFDVVQRRGEVEDHDDLTDILRNWGAAIQRDVSPLAPADELEGLLLHEEVRSLLERLDAEVFLARAEQAPGECRFFAVSALGAYPRNQRVDAGGIAPFRCLDPMRWALSGSGLLPDGHPEELLRQDEFGFAEVVPEVPKPAAAAPRPVPPRPVPVRRGQAFARVCLLLAILAAAAIGLTGYEMFDSIDVAAPPGVVAQRWGIALLAALGAAAVVLLLSLVAVVYVRPRRWAVVALLAAVVLPAAAAAIAYRLGTDVLLSRTGPGLALDRVLAVLESWYVPTGALRR